MREAGGRGRGLPSRPSCEGLLRYVLRDILPCPIVPRTEPLELSIVEHLQHGSCHNVTVLLLKLDAVYVADFDDGEAHFHRHADVCGPLWQSAPVRRCRRDERWKAGLKSNYYFAGQSTSCVRSGMPPMSWAYLSVCGGFFLLHKLCHQSQDMFTMALGQYPYNGNEARPVPQPTQTTVPRASKGHRALHMCVRLCICVLT